MAENDNFISKTMEFLRKEVCPLTNTEKCEKVIKDYSIHSNPLRLVDDVFTAIMECGEKHCLSNKDVVKEKLETYLKENIEE